MKGEVTAKAIAQHTGVTVTAALGAFVEQSLNDIAMWLLVMLTVIIVDLMMSVYKIIKVRDRKIARGEKLTKDDHVRWSKGLRDTMAKIATYFAFVVSMVFIANASKIDNFEIWGCMVVIFGESLSIIGNWCKAHGLRFNKNKLLDWGAEKTSLPEGLITEEDGED